MLLSQLLRIRFIANLLHHVLYETQILDRLNIVHSIRIYDFQSFKDLGDSYLRAFCEQDILVLGDCCVLFKYELAEDVQEGKRVDLIDVDVSEILGDKKENEMSCEFLQEVNNFCIDRDLLFIYCVIKINSGCCKQVSNTRFKGLYSNNSLLICKNRFSVYKVKV